MVSSGCGQIDFEESTHSYSIEGKGLESVTKVIGSVLNIDVSKWWKPEHRERGKYVHAITEAIDEDTWDETATVIPDGQDKLAIFERCHAYQQFLDLTGFKSLLVEARVASVTLGIAGTLDRYGLITKGRYAGRYAILDIKSGLPTAAATLQLGLYQILFSTLPSILANSPSFPATGFNEDKSTAPNLRIILHLRADGKCRPEFREGPGDLADALAVVRVWQYKKRNGIA